MTETLEELLDELNDIFEKYGDLEIYMEGADGKSYELDYTTVIHYKTKEVVSVAFFEGQRLDP